MRKIFIVLLFICPFLTLFAQNKPQKIEEKKLERIIQRRPKMNIKAIKEFAKRENIKWQKQQRITDSLAKKMKIPKIMKDKNGNSVILWRIKNGVPEYMGFDNYNAAKTISTNYLWDDNYNLSGFGIDIGLWDAGKVYTDHQEFDNATISWDDTSTTSTISVHSTELAGTMIAYGKNQNAHGMAKDASLKTFDIKNDLYEMADNSIFLGLSNHSYSIRCGWEFIKDSTGADNLYWMGNTSVSYNEDYKFGFYTQRSKSIDSLIYENPYYIVVTSAGNNRGEYSKGLEWHLHSDGKYYNDFHNKDGNSDGYDCLPGDFTTAKNTIVVGSIKDLPSGYISPYEVELDSSSGWGPTDDGRIKPDIVANGVDLITTGITSASDYDTVGGTSFACASVTGSIALIKEFINNNYSQDLLASTIKGLIIHTADDAGPEGPDYQFGWGVMNTKKVIDLLQSDIDDSIGSHIKELTFSNDPIAINIQCSGTEPLIVTICWTDPAANSPSPTLDPSDKMLVNDLDLTLTSENGTIYFPYTLDPNTPSKTASTGDNDIDNVEKIYLDSPVSGDYTVKITNEPSQFFTQDFSLIVSGGKFGNGSGNPPPPPPPSDDYYRVKVDQKLSDDSTSVGKVTCWNSTVPGYWNTEQEAPAWWTIDKKYDYPIITTKADKYVYNNQKFNRWHDNSPYIWERFDVTGDMTITSKMKNLGNATVKLFFYSANDSGIGTLFFKDPWYIDYSDSQYFYEDYNDPREYKAKDYRNLGNNAIFEEFDSTYSIKLLISDFQRKGVFLDQGYENGVWNPPYYSVKAEEQQTFKAHDEDITGYFLNWVGTEVSFQSPDNLETPVAFHADNAEARAVYKGHLASSVARATGYNNGRRIFKADNGTLYLVYEDNGDIWFTSSSDNGKTWNKETRVDSDDKTSLNPAIAGTLDMLFVTWFDQDDLNVKMRKYNISTSQWYPEHIVASVYYGNTIKPAPAIAVSEVVGTEYNLYIAFDREKMSDDFQPTGISEIVLYKNIDQDYDEWNCILGPFEGNNPSVSHSAAGSNGYIGLVWDHDGKIYFRGTDYYGNWTSTKQISDDLWYHENNCKPNISYTFGIAHIVWEGFHAITEMPTGYYRYYDVQNDALSDLTELPCQGADVYNLSVSTEQAYDSEHAYNYTVFYEADGIEKVDQTGNSFTQENFGEGKYPNIVDHGRDRAVWTQYTDAPYFLQTDYQDENNGGGISPVVPVYPTPIADYIISAQTNNSVEGDITLNIEHVILNHDTVYFDNSLNSQTMSVTQDYVPLEMDLKVRFHNVNTGLNDDDVLYSVVFGDSANETFLTNLKYRELPETNGNDFEKFLKVTTIVNLAGQTGKLRLKFNGVQPALVTKQLKVGEGDALGKNVSRKPVIPKAFALHQNFPNPFNPTTHITVDLPQDARVHLAVYNVTGQKVAELMNGSKPAGTYEIVFDGKNLASGVYIYRLTTDKGFVQSKKMMLIR